MFETRKCNLAVSRMISDRDVRKRSAEKEREKVSEQSSFPEISLCKESLFIIGKLKTSATKTDEKLFRCARAVCIALQASRPVKRNFILESCPKEYLTVTSSSIISR